MTQKQGTPFYMSVRDMGAFFEFHLHLGAEKQTIELCAFRAAPLRSDSKLNDEITKAIQGYMERLVQKHGGTVAGWVKIDPHDGKQPS